MNKFGNKWRVNRLRKGNNHKKRVWKQTWTAGSAGHEADVQNNKKVMKKKKKSKVREKASHKKRRKVILCWAHRADQYAGID